MRRYVLLLILACNLFVVKSQCLPNTYHSLDVNQVEASFNNTTDHFWDRNANAAYFVPKASQTSPVFASAFWIGGQSPIGQLHVAAATYRQYGPDYYSGPIRRQTSFTCDGETSLMAPMFRNGLKRLSNGKILLLDSAEVHVYDPQTAQVLVRPLPALRSWLDAIELADGRVMFYGDNLYPNKNPVLYMDTVNYNFTVGPTLIWFHKESSATQMQNGKVLLAGVVSCELFDPSNNTSVAVPDMLYPRVKHAAVRLPNGNVHVFGGGSSLNGTGATFRTQYFSDSLLYWFPGPDLAVPRNSPSVVTLPNGNYLILGGSISNTVCEIYDPVADTMALGPHLPKVSLLQNAVLVAPDKVFVAQRDNGPMTGMVSVIDLNSLQSEALRIELAGPQAVLLDSETVVVGYDSSTSMQLVNWKKKTQPKAKWQYVWKLNRSEIDQFRADFLANAVDFSRYPDIESWPAHGSVVDGEDRNLAPFVDVNLDGLYRPEADGDYPCIVGDQALWWVFNDQGVHNESKGLPMGLQIEAMAYAFDCSQTTCPDTALDYATFLHYEISNYSDSAWSDLYMGFHLDVDLGSYDDDFVGSDSTLSLAFVYNGDNMDANYGVNPPAWGASILPNGQIQEMNSMMVIENTFGAFNSNAQRPEEYYTYLQGRWVDGQPLVNNGSNGYPGSATGPTTGYMYPSTEGFCGGFLSGWSELTAGNTPFDRKFLESSGPFLLQPNESISYDVFFPFARGSSHTESVCALKNATAVMRDWWQNQLDRTCFSLVVANEPVQAAGRFKVIPNPVTGTAFIADFGAPLDGPALLELIDLNGRVVGNYPLMEGVDRQSIAVNGLPAGLYFARLTQGASIRVERVIKW
ncbi:MAG: T9SS type A sorting domain-containing protein [Bacteroidetes bacterium]|nr:T9SS type A sorting domain-containing protein [Bacteroidota bacterium]